MESSRRWCPADAGAASSSPDATPQASVDAARVVDAVERALDRHLEGRGAVAAAISGGRDSVALLDSLHAIAARRSVRVVAIHVHHGLSDHADAWQAFCAALCETRGIAFVARRVEVPRGARMSVEAEARRARYAALRDVALAAGLDTVLLAHHQDDQAETVLLQLLRGAGPHGLAAMPPLRADADGLRWVRPFLDVPRAWIEAYVRNRALHWVDDPSNADVRHTRNAIRATIAPALASLTLGYPATIGRAAALQAEAAGLVDDLAAMDAASAFDGATLDRSILATLSPPRARNVLRWFLRKLALPAPSAARLAAMHAQLATARVDASVRLAHGGVELGVHQGRVVAHRPAAAPFEIRWRGESALELPRGTLRFTPAEGRGISLAQLQRGVVVVRSRRGGERMQLASNRPARPLKALLQDARIPTWQRAALPFVWIDDALAAVPGIGVDRRFAASGHAAGLELDWVEQRGVRHEVLET